MTGKSNSGGCGWLIQKENTKAPLPCGNCTCPIPSAPNTARIFQQITNDEERESTRCARVALWNGSSSPGHTQLIFKRFSPKLYQALLYALSFAHNIGLISGHQHCETAKSINPNHHRTFQMQNHPQYFLFIYTDLFTLSILQFKAQQSSSHLPHDGCSIWIPAEEGRGVPQLGGLQGKALLQQAQILSCR